MVRIRKKLNKKAQHLTEYLLIVTLVMSGIIVMGPYVIRSWNANLKDWDSSIDDSMSDTLKEAPSGIPLPGCGSCTFENLCAPGVCCGDGTTCELNEQVFARQCYTLNGSPVLCGPPAFQCTHNAGCCSPWQPTGICGGLATPACGNKEEQEIRFCGDTAEYRCTSNPGLCDNKCINPFFNGAFCTGIGDVADEVQLIADTNYTAVTACTTAKCEIQCSTSGAPGQAKFRPNISGNRCEPAPNCRHGGVYALTNEGRCSEPNPNTNGCSCPAGGLSSGGYQPIVSGMVLRGKYWDERFFICLDCDS